MKLLNAISLNMLPSAGRLEFSALMFGVYEAAEMLRDSAGIENYIGHADLDLLIRSILEACGCPNIQPGTRGTVMLTHNERAIVAQYSGPRLPEGTTILPEGAKIIWYEIVYHEPQPIEEILTELAKEVPEEEWKKLPTDLTDNLDQHLYGR